MKGTEDQRNFDQGATQTQPTGQKQNTQVTREQAIAELKRRGKI
jgi:hypothetical protein